MGKLLLGAMVLVAVLVMVLTSAILSRKLSQKEISSARLYLILNAVAIITQLLTAKENFTCGVDQMWANSA